MDIFDLAAQLGESLREDPRLVALETAKKQYEEDRQLQALVIEYGVQQKALENQGRAEELDAHLVEMIQERINELYAQISTNEAYLALSAAQNEVNALMNAVNATITRHITGRDEGGCTHNCASCGGCHG